MKQYILFVLTAASLVQAGQSTYQYTGTVTTPMSVNNGTTIGAIGAGTPFTGTITFDDAQTVTPVAFSGGTRSTFTYTQMSLTMAGSTASWGPGNIIINDNLTSSASGYPTGDSMYANMSGAAPNGLFNGAQFNYIFLGFVDSSGTAFTAGKLPATMSLGSFASAFVEFNFGAWGQPYGAGNTSTLQMLSTLTKTGSVTTPPPTINTTSLPNGVVGMAYNAPIVVSGPNSNPLTTIVTGLPAGLSFNGSAITGTPTTVGTSSVNVTVTDTVTSLSTTAALNLTINAPAISFSPVLPPGVAGASYSAAFAPATGGTGSFTYAATGLPAGLALTGTTVAGTPTTAGSFNVMLTATDGAGAAITVATTLVINNATPVPCSGTNGVISAYVPRNPGFIVVNGGLNLLDHLWTTLLNPSNTTFLGGLVNWYQTGLVVDWSGTTDAAGCVLDRLTVRPRVTISTTSLPQGTTGASYVAPLTVSWGAQPYTVTVAGLPAGLTYSGSNIAGTPVVAGSFTVNVTVVDAVGATATTALPLTVNAQPIVFAPVLPGGTVGVPYTATLSATGFGPFTFTAAGLPAGLSLTGSTIAGTPGVAGTFAVTLTARDASGATQTANAQLVIAPGTTNYTIKDESAGRITAIGPDYLLVGAKKLIWNAATAITVNTPGGELHTITSFVKVGMKVQWKGLRNAATSTVLTSKLEVN